MKRALFIANDQTVNEAVSHFRGLFGTQLIFARNVADARVVLATHEIGLVISPEEAHPELSQVFPSVRFVTHSDFPQEKDSLQGLISSYLGL